MIVNLTDQIDWVSPGDAAAPDISAAATPTEVSAAATPSTGTPTTSSGVRSWGLDRIDQVNLPLGDSYHPGADGSNVHGEPQSAHVWVALTPPRPPRPLVLIFQLSMRH